MSQVANSVGFVRQPLLPDSRVKMMIREGTLPIACIDFREAMNDLPFLNRLDRMNISSKSARECRKAYRKYLRKPKELSPRFYFFLSDVLFGSSPFVISDIQVMVGREYADFKGITEELEQKCVAQARRSIEKNYRKLTKKF
jgi:hypothetical protein